MAEEQITQYQYFISSPFFAGFKDFNSPERKSFVESFENLPQKLKDLFVSMDVAAEIYSIHPGYTLKEAQVKLLAQIVRGVLLGTIFIGDMVFKIKSELGIDENTARDIANTLTSKIFSLALEDIKRLQHYNFSDKIRGHGQKTQSKPDIDPIIASQKEGYQKGVNKNNVLNLRKEGEAQG